MLWNLDKRFHGERLTCTDEQGRDGRGVQQVRMVEGGNVVTADPPAVTPPQHESVVLHLPGAEVWLQAAEAHCGNLQVGGPRQLPRGSAGSGGQQRGAQRGAQGGAQTPPQPVEGGYHREGGALPLRAGALLVLPDGGQFLHDPPVGLRVHLGRKNTGTPPPRSLVTASYFETFVCDHRQARGGRS